MTQRRDSVFENRLENEPGDQPQPEEKGRKAVLFGLLMMMLFDNDE